jgi:hypothetical protein
MKRQNKSAPTGSFGGLAVRICVVVVALPLAAGLFLISGRAAPNEGTAQSSTLPTPYPGKPSPSNAMPATTPAPAAQVACNPSDLKVDALWPGGYQGYATESVEFTNTSTTPCYFASAPSMSLRLTDGSLESASLGQFSSQRVDAQPGQAVLLIIGTPGTCPNVGTRQPVSSMTLTIPGGGEVAVSGLNLDVECGTPTVLIFQALAAPVSPPATSGPTGSFSSKPSLPPTS